jgi:seryl-tRNA synthetase
MSFKILHFIFTVFLVSTAIVCVNAQTNIDPRTGRPNQEEVPKSIKETLAKGRIDREKKDYEDLIKRGEESAKLSEELEQSFAKHNRLTPEDQKKLDRLEKNLKKIRSELGGDSDEEEENPSSIHNAFKALQSYTSTLVDELKKTTRYSISATAIETSNAVLKIVRFIRFGKN